MTEPAQFRVRLATCECAVPQIKPARDGHGRLVCEDCHGLIARAGVLSGHFARPGEPDAKCGPETIVWTPAAGRAFTRCGCGANILPGEFFAHAYEAGYRQSVEGHA